MVRWFLYFVICGFREYWWNKYGKRIIVNKNIWKCFDLFEIFLSYFFENHKIVGNSQNLCMKLNHETAGITKSEIMKCWDPLYFKRQEALGIYVFRPGHFIGRFCNVNAKLFYNCFKSLTLTPLVLSSHRMKIVHELAN